MSDRVGQQIGNYRLERLLGSGGFADVYLGKQVYLDSLAAIKLLKTNLAGGDIEDFRSEARTLVRLIHPNIVRILDFGLEDNTPFLVMDYAPNGTLRQRHARGTRLSLGTVVEYVNEVASALQYAHDQRIIHRDIKPENMLLGRQNEILLSDFGIAVVAQSTRTEFTQETVGTISYMAPEQIQAHPRPASDQYSLGVIVYEWLSGERPFNGSFTEIAVKHMMTPPPPLRERIPSISPEVEQVIFTALAKDPTQRFSNVRAFATALEQTSRGIRSNHPTLTQTQAAPMPTIAPTILASPVTPILPLMQPDARSAPARPQVEATAVDTPGTPFFAPSPAYIEAYAPTIATPHGQPFNPATPPPPAPLVFQRPPEPERKGMSRRAVLIAGVSAVGVVAIGGTAVLLATRNNPIGGQTGGGIQTTPSATTRKPTATATVTTQVNPNLLEQDNFHRTSQQFWGTASNGHMWGGDANKSTDFSIVNNIGQIQRQGNGNSLYTALLGSVHADAEVLVTAMLDTFNNSHIGAILRYRDDNHYYKVLLDQNDIHFLKRIDPKHGPTIGNTAAFSPQTNTLYSIRFRVTGTTLLAKAWQAGTIEPNGWMITAQDNDNTFQTGQGGLRPQINHGATLSVTMFQETLPTGQ